MAKRDVSFGSGGEAGGVAARILIFLLLAALVLGLAKLFSVQNSAPVTVWFYNWKFTSSLAYVIFLAICLGALVMALILLSFCVRRKFRKRAVSPGQRHEGPASGPARNVPETGPSAREGSTTPPQGAGLP
jgi:uncharacterized integral membrane protein